MKTLFGRIWLSIIVTFIFAGKLISEESAFQIIQQNESELIIKYLPQHYERKTIQIEGEEYYKFFSKSSGLTNEVGKPALPIQATLIALPPNKKLISEILESKFGTIENIKISPVPYEVVDEDGNVEEIFEKDIKYYTTQTNFYPGEIINVQEPFNLRDQLVSKISFLPFQYSPATKILRKITHLVFRLKIIDDNKSKRKWINIPANDKYFEDVYKSLILNYDQSKQWRVKEDPSNYINQNNSSQTWWNLSQQYYRIPIFKDGMYRLSYFQLLNVGIDLLTIQVPTIAIYYKGQSIPIYIQTGGANLQNWYIEFYATRKYGDSTFFDLYSDTSHYWLTWNDANPKRIIDQSLIVQDPVYSISNYNAFRHFEKDSMYYYGYNENEIRTITNVAGEGWYWLDFNPNNTKTINFSIDTLQPNRNGTAYLKARFNGMTAIDPPDTAISRHHVRVTLNGRILGESIWFQNQELFFTATFSDSILNKGNNSLVIFSVNIPSKVNKFYLDWFELTYSSPISVENNYLDFYSLAQPTSEPIQFRISKVTVDSIDIFDISSNRKIINLLKEGTIWTFKDTSESSKRYFVTGRNQRQIPSVITPHTFQNIRSHPTGADYIIITHGLFKSSAVQLANSRVLSGNLRTAVINVQDIYDEFNYGHLEPSAIKSFLKYAYDNWIHPKPSYITMFGDACWDFKKLLYTTTKTNFVPGFGIPMSDNALVCFDSVYYFLPSMIIGRIPVENAIQATRVVNKIINYDNPPMEAWNKRTLFITGGNTAGERGQFNALSELLINESVSPPPLGGEVFRVYKTSSAIIDDGYKSYMQSLVNEGLSFINFIGHSGGRLWNVDIGNPVDLQNTTGKLPFISSVSCNIGAFYSNFANVLSEDFLVADNRGGIATWASSHIGSAQTGYWLAKKFLYAAVRESIQTFGELTHLSRIYFWMINGYVVTPTIIHTFNLYPLIGDTYSRFPLPNLPDFVLTQEFVKYSPVIPISDNFISLSINVKNYGLMPNDSVLISIRDNYTDETGKYLGEIDIVPPFFWKPIAYSDTITIEWDVRGKAGSHIVKIAIDPNNTIEERNENNNSVEMPVYVYKNVIHVLNPYNFSIVPQGQQNLRVTVPTLFDTTYTPYAGGGDSLIFPKNVSTVTSSFTFYFELDTTITFDSPIKITSPQITPSPAYAEWATPNLVNNRIYFWRARTYNGIHYGAWLNASFNVCDSAYNPSVVKWKQENNQQFSFNEYKKVSFSDSGVTLQRTNGLPLFVRSLGYRAYPDSDYYSIIKIGETIIYGHWWQEAESYLVARIDPLTGRFEAKGYSLRTIGQPDSMFRFLQTAPVGNYIAIAVVRNGRDSMNNSLYQMIESLGATNIRLVTAGQSWSLISRKGTTGPMMEPLEDYSPNGVAIVSYQMPNYYSNGAGEIASTHIGPSSSWANLYWNNLSPPNTNIHLKIIGIKKDFTIDTLITVQSDERIVNLSNIDAGKFHKLQVIARLSNQYGENTPLLNNWCVTYSHPTEIALSSSAFKATPHIIKNEEPLSVTVSVFNLSNFGTDSLNLSFSLNSNQILDSVLINSIEANEFTTITKKIDVGKFYGDQLLITKVEPRSGVNDQILENNTIYFPFFVESKSIISDNIIITFDDKEIQKGDYVSSNPKINITLPKSISFNEVTNINLNGNNIIGSEINKISNQDNTENNLGKLIYNPKLDDGNHILTIFNKNNVQLTSLEFKVQNKAEILNAYNYPNPFTTQTFFTFELTGSKLPEKGMVRIYTVSGRKIKDITILQSELSFGLNKIIWDGRDADGNEIANGIYLYKIKIVSENEIISPINKLLKLR